MEAMRQRGNLHGMRADSEYAKFSWCDLHLKARRTRVPKELARSGACEISELVCAKGESRALTAYQIFEMLGHAA
eukprot:CAMPEP_0202048274 /NCGR_PEP_ID=MMETSP0963-20130614/2590_1 /ASSEMBLY_ACC=CAM_ASM_000494 /TAXON_ID=4773 /ORGANISM="Schizochytrium aggregatum, Strain ATCC28209" /LENGTH=74 /DNA_ID=CAMNT_0048613143 /DNA_START=75 /DNA_END=296 /DNA_ORIENTATION=+